MLAQLLPTLVFALAGSPTDGVFQDLSLPEALAQAKSEKKLVMIDFFTTWCAPCKKLDRETWPDERVQTWFGRHAIALKVDAEKDTKLAGTYNIKAYPTLLFLDADGIEIERLVGYREPGRFVRECANIRAGMSQVDLLREQVTASGGKDPQLRSQLAKELARRGEPAAALEEYLWCWDHGIEHSPGYSGVRRSFLLQAIIRLGKEHPPALAAMRARRDACAQALESAAGTADQAADLVAINGYLGERERTLAAYDALPAPAPDADPETLARDEARRYVLFRAVSTALLEARRYQELLAVPGGYLASIERNVEVVEQMARDMPEDKTTIGVMRGRTFQEGGRYYEALLALERPQEAAELVDRLLELQSNGSAYKRLIRHAVRAGAPEQAEGLAERARKALPADQHPSIERALRPR